MTLLITLSKKHICNVEFINVISEVIISKVIISKVIISKVIISKVILSMVVVSNFWVRPGAYPRGELLWQIS